MRHEEIERQRPEPPPGLDTPPTDRIPSQTGGPPGPALPEPGPGSPVERPMGRSGPPMATPPPAVAPGPGPADPRHEDWDDGESVMGAGAPDRDATDRHATDRHAPDPATTDPETGTPDRAGGPEVDGEPRADRPATGTAGQETDSGAVLFGDEDVERFRTRWRELQADFVDDPQQAVRGADGLVGEVMSALNEIFARHKSELEGQWQGGGETEQLRVALRRYRSFLDQLLTST